jgi:hypothetical protein
LLEILTKRPEALSAELVLGLAFIDERILKSRWRPIRRHIKSDEMEEEDEDRGGLRMSCH